MPEASRAWLLLDFIVCCSTIVPVGTHVSMLFSCVGSMLSIDALYCDAKPRSYLSRGRTMSDR